MHNKHTGFTLIELSIVLIIIGLIIGGVLVGQDMIKSAEIRATVQQVEKYNTAMNTFRGKYGGLPGDISSRLAARFGMEARAGTAGRGDDDGILENGYTGGAVYIPGLGYETALFWRDLSFANLIEGSFTAATDAPAANLTVDTFPDYLPKSKLRGLYMPIFSANAGNYYDTNIPQRGARNYYEITGLTSTNGNGEYTAVATSMTPTESYLIDTKIDDGLPYLGLVRSMRASNLNTLAYSDDGGIACVYDGANPEEYYINDENYANRLWCQLRIEVK